MKLHIQKIAQFTDIRCQAECEQVLIQIRDEVGLIQPWKTIDCGVKPRYSPPRHRLVRFTRYSRWGVIFNRFSSQCSRRFWTWSQSIWHDNSNHQDSVGWRCFLHQIFLADVSYWHWRPFRTLMWEWMFSSCHYYSSSRKRKWYQQSQPKWLCAFTRQR